MGAHRRSVRGPVLLALAVAAAGVLVVPPALAEPADAPPEPTTTHATAPDATGPGAGVVVDIAIDDNVFRPKKVKVAPGTTIRWTNEGRNEHNVLPDKGKRFGIDEIPLGESYEHRFDKPGRYGYYCSFHGAPRTGQFGTIVVKKPKGSDRGKGAASEKPRG